MHRLTFQLLVALRNGAADGNTLLERLRHLDARVSPSLPTLYRCLRAALAEKWIEVEGTREQPGLGRPRQTFALTRAGEEAVREEATQLEGLARLALAPQATRGER